MNNSGRYCSIRAYLDTTYKGLTKGCAAPCDPKSTKNWNAPPDERVQLWFK